VISPAYVLDQWMYFLTIYSNTSGEIISFKTWIAESDTILSIS